jgi:hypothetical protein
MAAGASLLSSRTMDSLRLVFRFVHFLAWAALLGGLVLEWSKTNKTVSPAVLWGARLAFVAGIVLVGIKEMLANQGGPEVNHAKVGIKFVLGAVPVGVLEVANRRGLGTTNFFAAFSTTVVAIAVAVFWV